MEDGNEHQRIQHSRERDALSEVGGRSFPPAVELSAAGVARRARTLGVSQERKQRNDRCRAIAHVVLDVFALEVCRVVVRRQANRFESRRMVEDKRESAEYFSVTRASISEASPAFVEAVERAFNDAGLGASRSRRVVTSSRR